MKRQLLVIDATRQSFRFQGLSVETLEKDPREDYFVLSRLGYCDYSCNACSQVCPSEAIPDLTLEDKRQAVMGLAYIDQDRCIPWTDNVDCIVCEEVCPVSDKAIEKELIPRVS